MGDSSFSRSRPSSKCGCSARTLPQNYRSFLHWQHSHLRGMLQAHRRRPTRRDLKMYREFRIRHLPFLLLKPGSP